MILLCTGTESGGGLFGSGLFGGGLFGGGLFGGGLLEWLRISQFS